MASHLLFFLGRNDYCYEQIEREDVMFGELSLLSDPMLDCVKDAVCHKAHEMESQFPWKVIYLQSGASEVAPIKKPEWYEFRINHSIIHV